MLSRRVTPRGMTLIELIVAMTIIALALLAAMPSIGGWIGNTQVRNTALSIQAGLVQARTEAVRRNQAVRFSLVSLTDSSVMDNSCALSSNGVSWVVSLDDPATKCAVDPSDSVTPRIVNKQGGGVGGKNVVVSAVQTDNTAASSVTFNGFGRVADATPLARIDVDNQISGGDNRALRILLSAGGNVRTCDIKVTSPTDPRKC